MTTDSDRDDYFFVPSLDGAPERIKRFTGQGLLSEGHLAEITAVRVDPYFSEWMTSEDAWVVLTPAPVPLSPRPPPVRVVAVDLGLAQDYSAVCVSEARCLNPGSTGRPEYEHRVGHLQRWPLQTPYRQVARDVAALCAALPEAPALVIDGTGVGVGVAELFLEERPRYNWWCPVTITSADGAAPNGRGGWNVGKRVLVSALSVASQNRRLAVARGLPEAATLTQEMSTFRARIAPSGHVSYEGADWRTGAHDDVLLATSLAVWAAEQGDQTPRFWI